MIKWKYSPPAFVKMLFPEFRWNTANGKILVTFDDGPVAGNTEKILKLLDEYKVKCLFFVVGNNLKQNPELTREILSEGHQIGCHMMNHEIITKMKPGEISENINSVKNLCRELLGVEINYFRPPHGRFDLRTNRLLNSLGLTNVMWSLITYDFTNDFSQVKYSIDKYLRKNSIVVFHDSLKSSEIITDSLKYLFDKAAENGMKIGEPAECLK